MRKIGNLKIMKCLLRNLFRIFPVHNNKIVFDSYYGKGYGDNPKYIAEEILRQKLNCKLVWLKNTPTVIKDRIKAVSYYSIRFYYELATARIIIVNCKGGITQFIKKKKNQILLQTWHGDFPLKYIEKEAEDMLNIHYIKASKADSKITDAIVSGNPYFSKILQESFWLSDNCEILEYGVPRNDMYFKGENFRNQLKLKYGFSLKDRILLYAPTFRDDIDTSCYNIDFEKLKTVLYSLDNSKWKIIIRLHPNIAEKSDLFAYNSDIINGTCYSDPQELCMISDCLITDYSSIMSDFMLTNKPVFLYTPDIEKYTNQKSGRGLRDIFYKLPFALCRSQEELDDSIKNFEKETYLAKIKVFMQDYYKSFDNGKASERVVNYLAAKTNNFQ